MQDWQQRVIDEKKELDEKISKLGQFIAYNMAYTKLSDAEQTRLENQRNIMTQYSDILKERIENFKG